jgi:hypothetical protein
MLPGSREVERTYHGASEHPLSTMERLLEATEGPFNGTGSMRRAFTDKSAGWKRATRGKPAEELERLHAEREGERLALVAWIRSGADADAYARDEYRVPPELAGHPVTPDFLAEEGRDPCCVKIQSLIHERCVRCHDAQGGDEEAAQKYPLDNYDRLKPYLQVKTATAMSLPKLAQTTHVHLLGFAMLYGLTGAIFCLTSYPGWVRGLVGPLALVAQLVDISCWWLARLDPLFADTILVTGGLVALGLLLQIVGSLLDLFGRAGRVALLLIALAAISSGYVVKEKVINPYLDKEKLEATTRH